MRLEQLEYLIEIANSNSISIAAQNLYVSQPALSRSIKTLEEELGVDLLSRTVDGVRLTCEGEKLLPIMLEILASVDGLKQQARLLQCPSNHPYPQGTFRLYTLPVLADSLVLPALEHLGSQFPKVEIQTHMLDLDDFPNMSIPLDADLIMFMNIAGLLDPTIKASGFHMEPMFTGNSFLVVGQNHPLSNKKIITRSEVLSQKLIAHYNGIDLNLLYEALTDIPSPINVVFRSNNTRLIIQTLQKQEVALLTNNLLLQMDYIKNQNLRVIPIKNSRIQYFCLYKKDHPHLPFIQTVIETLKTARNRIAAEN